jgi:hypothetical protein
MRFAEGYGDMPSKDGPLYDRRFHKSSIDPNEPIDLGAIKAEIAKFGPVELWRADDNVKFVLSIYPCPIEDCNCGRDVIAFTQLSGFTSLSTPIDEEKLLEHGCLNDFVHDFFHNPFAYYSSSGERQHIEQEIHKHLGFSPMKVYRGLISPAEIKHALSEEIKGDPWALHNLQGIFRTLLLQRMEIQHFDRDDFEEELKRRFVSPEDLIDFLRYIYDLGFLTSRMIGEHFIREEIEPIAGQGLAARDAQARRNDASGRSASKKRNQRISEMLERIEALISENPALGRLGLSQIANLAIEDAAAANPTLWSQGKGQREEYLDEIKSDLRFRERYKKILKKTA